MEKESQLDVWKGTTFWTKEIEKAGVKDHLPYFNDVITDKEAPSSYGEPMVTDISLDGLLCDIYHTDRDGGTYHRIFIHIKE